MSEPHEPLIREFDAGDFHCIVKLRSDGAHEFLVVRGEKVYLLVWVRGEGEIEAAEIEQFVRYVMKENS